MKIQFKTDYLTTWRHGTKHDPNNWPIWKFFSTCSLRMHVQPPTSAYRLWLYTRTKAYYFDLTFEPKPTTTEETA